MSFIYSTVLIHMCQKQKLFLDDLIQSILFGSNALDRIIRFSSYYDGYFYVLKTDPESNFTQFTN